MHAFQPETFAALSPAKAKAAALALFDSAMLEPAADWRGVAYALHSVVSRKRGAGAGPVSDDIAMQDAADASEFAAWADYPATGKAANIARGRVTVTFADGWSKTVGMLAGRTAKGRKPWSIAHAVRFAVICYKIAAVRRATGSDAAIYFDKGGNASGETITLDALICAPEIVSVISAESAETVAGDLVWNPDDANAFTRDQRAGAVTVSNAYGPHTLDASRAVYAARGDLLARLGLVYVASYALAKAAAERVEALLWPAEIVSRSRYDFDCLASVIEAEPSAYPWDADMVRDFTDSPGLAEMAGFTPDVADAPAVIEAVTADRVEAEESPMPSDVSGGDHDDADAPANDEPRQIKMKPIVSKDQDGRWSVWKDDKLHDIADVWPGCIVVIGGSHRAGWRLNAESLATVHGLPYPQSGAVETLETVLAIRNNRGLRFTGPRSSMKAFRAEVAHRDICDRMARADLPKDGQDPFIRAFMGWRSEYQRGDDLALALSAFLSHDESKAWADAERAAWDAERGDDASGEPQEADATVAAATAAVEPPAPVSKPRYRYSPISGVWEIVPPADAMPIAA